MSKMDRLLTHLTSRGGIVLRMEPGEPPIMELPGGHHQNLMAQEMLGTVLDGLAKEIIPEALNTDYMRGERVTFEYPFEGVLFHVVCNRTKFGTHIVMARLNLPGVSQPPRTAPTLAADGSAGGVTGLGKLDPYLRRLLAAGGSDLYLSPDEPPTLRKDGVMETVEDQPILNGKALEEVLRSILPPAVWEICHGGQETEYAFTPPGLMYRLRLRVVPDLNGPALALRVIPRVVPDAAALGLSLPIRRLANLNKGLVLLSGPSGSGKTTTLACLLDSINRNRKAFILTVQDSIEFEFVKATSLIRQKETCRDFSRQIKAIRAALQMDPDVLALGELRNREAIDLALQGAQMGHLVFAQIPAATLVDTCYWVVDAFPADHRSWVRSRLADHLKAVLGHALFSKVGGGRIAAIETLFNNSTIAGHLREGRLESIPTAMKGGRYGQTTHTEALVRLIQEHRVEPMEAYQRCQDREAFIAACKKGGIPFDPRAEGQVTDQ